MKFLWCDTETTGLKTENAKPFQIAFIFVFSKNEEGSIQKAETERIYYLNPFEIPGVEYSPEAAEVHGYTKEQIEAFPSAKETVAVIKRDLEDFMKFVDNEKMFFCGYNCKFDYEHMESLFSVFGEDFNKYFLKNMDVYEQVKRAGDRRVLPFLENRKLTTVAKHLNIGLEKAHDALSDIRATREVAKSLTQKGINLL